MNRMDNFNAKIENGKCIYLLLILIYSKKSFENIILLSYIY